MRQPRGAEHELALAARVRRVWITQNDRAVREHAGDVVVVHAADVVEARHRTELLLAVVLHVIKFVGHVTSSIVDAPILA